MVSVAADGTRYNMGPLYIKMDATTFENFAVKYAIEKIYDDQLISDRVLNVLGVSAIAESISKSGFHVLYVNKEEQGAPQIIAMKDGRTVSILVRAEAYPDSGNFIMDDEQGLAEIFQEHQERDRDLYFASLTLFNSEARNDWEKRAILKNGSYELIVSKFRKLDAPPRNTVDEDDLSPAGLEFVAGFGAMTAAFISEKLDLPKSIEDEIHLEYSLFGVYLAHKFYTEIVGLKTDPIWTVLTVLTTPPFASEAIDVESEEFSAFESFARPAIVAYEAEAERHLTPDAAGKRQYLQFGKAAAKAMIMRMNGLRKEPIPTSLIEMSRMEEALSMSPESLWSAFSEMDERGALPR